MNTYIVSDDKSKLNIGFIHSFLTNSYWAEGRSLETVEETIKHSDCFGLYYNEKQIGFARVLTDYAIFAYLLDVFIIEEYRGQGLSKKLLSFIFENPKYANVKKWKLATRDAHGLYQRFGFKAITKPERLMEKIVPGK